MLPFHLSGLWVNLYELGEISAECLHFARPLSIAMTDFIIDPYALYCEQSFCFQYMCTTVNILSHGTKSTSVILFPSRRVLF